MSKQFGRVATLQIGTLQISGLAFEFAVKHDATGKPNTAEVTVYNLSESHRKACEKNTAVELIAGYKDNTGVIFSGQILNAISSYSGADIGTAINATDGTSKMQKSRVAFAVNPGETSGTIMERAVAALEVGEGNLASVITAIANRPSLYPFGGAVHGSAFDELTRIASVYGYQVSIQQGALLLLESKSIRRTAEVISADTGLAGPVKIDAKGKVSFDCLLRPSMAIGDAIKVESAGVSGFYRVLEFEHKGHTHQEAPWTTSVTCDGKV